VAVVTVERNPDGVLTATLRYADLVREGVRTNAVGRGPIVQNSPSPVPDPVTPLFGSSGFSTDNQELAASGSPILTLPSDITIELRGLEDGAFLAFPQDPDRRLAMRYPTLTAPADLAELVPGAWYRVIVAGKLADGSVVQFAFDVDTTPDPDLHGRALIEALELPVLEEPDELLGCRYRIDFGERSYCLDPAVRTSNEAAAMRRQILHLEP
jgi:hypothetical protein